MGKYFDKMKGGKRCPPRAPATEIFVSWLGGFLGIALIGLLGNWLQFKDSTLIFYNSKFLHS